MRGPPARVREGKLFHEHVQVVLVQLDEGLVPAELEEASFGRQFGDETGLRVRTARGVERDVRADFVAIVRTPVGDPTTIVIDEMKASRWERMTPRNRQRNIARYARQTWRYIDSLEADGFDVAQASVHFPWCADAAVREEVEYGYTHDADDKETWEGLGLSVVWWGEDQWLEDRAAQTFLTAAPHVA
jgi:hypothetical protein